MAGLATIIRNNLPRTTPARTTIPDVTASDGVPSPNDLGLQHHFHNNAISGIRISVCSAPNIPANGSGFPQLELSNFQCGPISQSRPTKRARKDGEALHPQFKTCIVSRDPCFGIAQPRRMGAINNTGTGWAGGSSSGALLLMPDQRYQPPTPRKQYDADRSGSSMRYRSRFRDRHPSEYQVQMGSQGMPLQRFSFHRRLPLHLPHLHRIQIQFSPTGGWRSPFHCHISFGTANNSRGFPIQRSRTSNVQYDSGALSPILIL